MKFPQKLILTHDPGLTSEVQNVRSHFRSRGYDTIPFSLKQGATSQLTVAVKEGQFSVWNQPIVFVGGDCADTDEIRTFSDWVIEQAAGESPREVLLFLCTSTTEEARNALLEAEASSPLITAVIWSRLTDLKEALSAHVGRADGEFEGDRIPHGALRGFHFSGISADRFGLVRDIADGCSELGLNILDSAARTQPPFAEIRIRGRFAEGSTPADATKLVKMLRSICGTPPEGQFAVLDPDQRQKERMRSLARPITVVIRDQVARKGVLARLSHHVLESFGNLTFVRTTSRLSALDSVVRTNIHLSIDGALCRSDDITNLRSRVEDVVSEFGGTLKWEYREDSNILELFGLPEFPEHLRKRA